MTDAEKISRIAEIVQEYLDNEAKHRGEWRTVTMGDITVSKIEDVLK